MNRIHKPVGFFILLLSLFSFERCGHPKDAAEVAQLPADSILIPVLVDVQLAEAALKSFKPAERDSMTTIYYDRIGRLHGHGREDILNWLSVLNTHPQSMERIYQKVLEELNRQDAKDISD